MNTEAQFLRYGHYYDKIDLYIAECNFYKNLVEKAHFTHSPIIKMNNFLPINQEYKAYYEHDNYILYFGRYAREKGVLTILKAYAKMHCDEKLVLVGKGSEEDSVDYIMAVPASENHLLGIISVLIEKTIGKGRIFSGTYYILLGALIARTRIFAKAKIILPVLVGTFLAAAFLNLFLMKIIMSVMFFMLVLMCNCSGDGRKFRRTSTVMYYIPSVQTLYDLEKALNLPECALVKRVNGQAEVDASQWSEEKEQVGRACRELEHALAANLTKSNLRKASDAISTIAKMLSGTEASSNKK
ncbi:MULTISPECIES: hypothetical protein [Faecalibacterium]|uniref:hypothetical protein n=1 Tax=Faecalibacterium TaxID=216851 RepID=UPI000E492E1B|nr:MULTISPECIES: hypothetical protein [Faecalibacterium]